MPHISRPLQFTAAETALLQVLNAHQQLQHRNSPAPGCHLVLQVPLPASQPTSPGTGDSRPQGRADNKCAVN